MPVTNLAGCTGRGNPLNNTSARYPASTAIPVGTFLYQDSAGLDQPATAFTYVSSNLAQTQRNFKAVFRGVYSGKRIAGQTTAGTDKQDEPIYTAGEFTAACSALGTAVVPGQFVGLAANGGGTALLGNTVAICTEDCAIGVVTEHAAVGLTELTFNLIDTVTTGGSNFSGAYPGFGVQQDPTALTTSATLTGAQLLTGLLTASQGASGAATYTLPTGTLMDGAVGANFPINGFFDFSLVNISTTAGETATLAAGSGFTIVGNPATTIATAATRSSVRLRARRTAANTWIAYVIG